MDREANRKFAIEVVNHLRDEGFDALWAGGCVRDLVLGHDPADYDVATSATPRQVRRIFGRRRTLSVGESFGVVVVLPPERNVAQIEVATFRTDGGYSDGRRPDRVTFSTAEQDALRRDFTINGMFYDPQKAQVIDYVDGQRDLNRQLIRAIGDPHQRIQEDKLRMLRAIRFAARFGFELEPATYSAICAHAAELSSVSGERIAVELRKTLATERAAWAMAAWVQSGLMRQVLPAVSVAWPHASELTGALLHRIEASDWRAKLAAVIWAAENCGAPALAVQRDASTAGQQLPNASIIALRESLKMSNDDIAAVDFAVVSQRQLDQVHLQRWSVAQPLLVDGQVQHGVTLLAARADLNDALEPALRFARDKLSLDRGELDPPPLLSGADLIQAGRRPGPEFKQILDQARALQLDGQLESREAALDWARQ